ncbi:hypothetical protein JTE90_026351 [Oedothorax gibbosus]|uniref:MACPF domain-containing protein n=1 Tax=Oedothorax gibbosus TaxID=931172 RepID=A0AAV6UJ67_9ARAC|nr:hypothetical protein JTE90_026351 [Oedothorax gibbosus]
MLLGQTYDLGKERTGLQIFPADVEKNAQRIERYSTDSQYRMVENAAEVKDFLDIQGKLSLKVKSGLVDVSGEGAYLKDSSSKTDGLEILVKLHFETVTFTIPSWVKPNADWSLLNEKFIGTHYCRSITYGGDLIASVRVSANNAFDLQRIKGAINGGVNAKSFEAEIKGKLEMLQQNAADTSSLEISYYASVPLQGVSHDIEGLLKLVEQFPEHVKKVNDGLGNPLRMELHDLAALKQGAKPYLENRALTDELEDLEFQFDDLRETRRKLGIWVTALPPAAPEGVNKKIEQFTDQVNRVFGLYLQTIADLDVSKGASTQPLKDAFAAYGGKDGDMLPHKYVRMLTALQKDIYESNPELKPRVGGALYTRWGRGECPKDEEASVVGVMSSSEVTPDGGSGDFVCIPPDPINPSQKDYFQGEDDPDDHLIVSPLRYVGEASRFSHMSLKQVSCAKCRVAGRTASLMMVASTKCPSPEWTLEYSGVLMAPGMTSGMGLFVCMDSAMAPPDQEEGRAPALCGVHHLRNEIKSGVFEHQ